MVDNSFDGSEAGTPESVWHAWDRTFPPLDLTPCRELVVVAPHPDDEILGVGGLMAVASAAGVPVTIVAVTDGGGSHEGSPTLSKEQLIAERPEESRRALEKLSVQADPIRLGIGDGAVADREDDIADALADIAGSGAWCLTTWRGDRHPDHEATARACWKVASRTGIRVVEYPVWMWHWAKPDHPDVPWERARAVALDPHIQSAKHAAVQEFRTQIAPLSDHPADRAVLPPHVLDRLLRPYEVVFA
ncbi:PIG-L deacetylase family protein [Rhodococcoides kyotonense]|uniref:N-acetylglucosaminyl deacetylase, LmbE family n=1 Tax=Rhodococcoides kyotonense TaxID=398843 RepID=A0A239JKF3_9NOCA|nr:PIG-L family deacetylase [Rhodococcus kyotonensis]SNT06327.1 N-acetylglucosaminyl deacetylase, LmbE family [Rhodococcus kyotonensis]